MENENEVVQTEDTGQEAPGAWRDKPVGVELADGTFLNASAGYSNGDLWIWMQDEDDPDNNIVYLVGLFTDPEKTETITYHGPGGTEQAWGGMTKLVTANTDGDNKISLRLRRE